MSNKKDERLDTFTDEDVIEEVVADIEIPKQRDFFKIPRRFGSIPVDELPLGCDPEHQYRKIYPRVPLPFQKADRVPFGHPKKSPYSLEYYDSSWEEEYMKELENDATVAKWTKNHGLRINYFNAENKFKIYIPDFLVEKTDGTIELVEMKGTHLLKNPDTKKKIEYAKKWCEARKITYRIISKYQ